MNDERGFLLTELTVTIALLVVVLAVGFIFFFFCQRSFYEGEKKTIVQSNVRLAANYITKEVRYADNISATDMSGVKNHCLKLDDNNLKKVTKEADGSIQTQTQTITRDDCLTGLSFSVDKNNNNKVVLTFTITGNDGTLKDDIVIESEMLLENISVSKLTKIINAQAIYFTKPSV
ncbi:MAG: hypothetical protein PHS89_07240 [Syntrophaceticus schinkii]|jgi:Tfp pilus assembly protein PilW|nr:hypothetical protein [Syntrophaceticus schinkii]